MPKSAFVDFKAVKAAITMEQVLSHYGLMDQFKRGTDSLNGPCPIHKGSNPTQFRVSISKNIWNCFSECKHGGNVLDFIARMENAGIHAAALKAIEWFSLEPEGAPKYKLPPGFRKSQELFNLDRAFKAAPEQPLLIVEGFFDCMKIHDHGYQKVVALMGSSLSQAQEELIRQHTNCRSRIIVMLDENEAGITGREDLAARLSQFCFVRVHPFGQAGMEPEHLSEADLADIVEGRQ